MSETRRRKIYAGYYDRYDRKPFYVVCEAADYDTGEVNIIIQEYLLLIQSFSLRIRSRTGLF